MNEIRNMYYEDLAAKSKTKNSAFHRNGGASEKLGNKQLTRKEIEERHGPVTTYSMDDFLSFQQFREMPTEWQAKYLNHLQDTYDIGLTQIGRDLFGQRDDSVLRSHLKLNRILADCNPDKRRGRTKLHEFRRDIREYRTAPKKEKSEEKPEENPAMNFMDYEQFKALAPEKQAEFVKRILAEYGVGIKNIGEDLFGLKNGTSLTNYLHRHLPAGLISARRNIGDTRSAAYKAKFERFRRDIQLWKRDGAFVFSEFAAAQIAAAVSVPEAVLETVPVPAEIEACSKALVQKLNESDKKQPDAEMMQEVDAMSGALVKTEKLSFSASYISTGFDMTQVELIRKLFEGQKIRVTMEVEAL